MELKKNGIEIPIVKCSLPKLLHFIWNILNLVSKTFYLCIVIHFSPIQIYLLICNAKLNYCILRTCTLFYSEMWEFNRNFFFKLLTIFFHLYFNFINCLYFEHLILTSWWCYQSPIFLKYLAIFCIFSSNKKQLIFFHILWNCCHSHQIRLLSC